MIEHRTIDELLERSVSGGAMAGVIAIVGDRDNTLYQGAFGQLGIEDDRPARMDTMLAIASMTKAITSVAALQLIEQGRLELEQTVASVLPAFGELQVLDGFDGDTPRLRAPASQANIRQLLTHTSGLGYAFANADLLRYYQLRGIDPIALGNAMLDGVPLVADPGTRWEYGTSTDWLGVVVQALSGQSLAAYCEQHIFTPLGMTDTTFTPSEQQSARMMALHTREPDGGLAVSPLELSIEPGFFSGGAGAYSTAGDYLRFLRALLRGGELDGERILAPETIELMFGDHLNGAPLPEIIRSALPELTNDVPALPMPQGWGLGLNLLLQDIPGMRRAGTGSWAGLFNCYYWIDRTTGVTAAVLTQVLPFFDARVVQTMLELNGAIFSGVGNT